jgi:integrase
MGTIYKRGNVYWIKYYGNGRTYRESSRSRREDDAKRLLKKREGEIAEGKTPGVRFDRVKFDELADDFLSDYEINQKKSLDRAKLSVKHLRRTFVGVRAPNITTTMVNAYIKKRQQKEGAANGSINRELAALKAMFNLAAKQTPPKVAYVPYIPKLEENNVRKGFFEYGNFLALRGELPDYLKGFATFAYKTGWRVSEITGLTWDQVDRGQGIVRLEVGDTKNKEGRTVYLDEELREAFSQQWVKRQSGKLTPYVFPNREGTGKIRDFRDAWATGCKKAKIGKRWFHDFRRSAVRDMVRSGIPDLVAMKISGHKTRSVFDRYNIVSDTDLKEAAAKREAYQRSQIHTESSTIHDFQKKRINRDME